MIKTQFFLGYQLDVEEKVLLLDKKNYYAKTFINNDKKYLTTLNIDNTLYVGKFLGSRTTTEQVELAEKNILSLLKSIITLKNKPLKIITKIDLNE